MDGAVREGESRFGRLIGCFFGSALAQKTRRESKLMDSRLGSVVDFNGDLFIKYSRENVTHKPSEMF